MRWVVCGEGHRSGVNPQGATEPLIEANHGSLEMRKNFNKKKQEVDDAMKQSKAQI
jgi:hypothetical protein